MTRIARFSVLALLAIGLIGPIGCSQNNEETAGITGVANPEVSGPSDYEAYSRASQKGAGMDGQEGYPGQ